MSLGLRPKPHAVVLNGMSKYNATYGAMTAGCTSNLWLVGAINPVRGTYMRNQERARKRPLKGDVRDFLTFNIASNKTKTLKNQTIWTINILELWAA